MSPDPYSTPNTLEVVDSPPLEVPSKILKKIEKAWGIGVIASLLLVVSILTSSNRQGTYFAMWNWGTLVFILALTFGVYRRSRICALLLLLTFVSWIGLMALVGKTTGIVLLMVLSYYSLQGVIGTFAYHRFIRAQRSQQGNTAGFDPVS